MTRYPRYDLNALIAAAGRPTHRVVADVAGVKLATVRQWVRRGLLSSRADELANWFGVDPWAVWPSWFDDTPETVECEHPDCTNTFEISETGARQRYCRTLCGQRHRNLRKRLARLELLAAA